jgi:hypothetical protein
MPMTRATSPVGLLLLLLLLGSTSAHADHDSDHRYSVRGYLVDDRQRPIADAIVVAQLDGARVSGRTDDKGYYNLVMHLHDQDIGREIQLQAGAATASVRMRAEAGNRHSERIHWASFVDGRLREDDLGRFRMPGWAWALLAASAAIGLLVGGVKLQAATLKRRRATERAAGKPGQQTRHGKTKRSKDRKRRR